MEKSKREKGTRKKDSDFPSREELDMLAESLQAGFGLAKKDPDNKTLPK